MKRKVCMVVQRYGLEVNGGAELLCRQLAEHLCLYAEVHVATTKAINYTTWSNEYSQDYEVINGVHVHRFGVEHERNVEEFNRWTGEIVGRGPFSSEEEQKWVDAQGPYVPNLIEYLKNSKDEYDAFIFNTYLYYPTVMGVRVVGEKAIVIPDAHDEPYINFSIFKDVFNKVQALLYNTEEEQYLVHKKFYNHLIRCDIGGAGVDIPGIVDEKTFKNKYKLDNYIIYVGRIDIGKNCHQMFKDFISLKERYPSDLKLVLMGKEGIPVPKRDDIVSLGFVDDTDKFNGISGAKALILPSQYESLSIVVLEAFTQKIPVIVNGACDVLKAHCIKSNAGFYYYNTGEFCEFIQYLLKNPHIAKKMGENGLNYVNQNYQWDIIMEKLMSLIEYVCNVNGEEKI